MNPLLIIQALNALMDVAPKGVSLFVQVRDLLQASDEPEAKLALARLEAIYKETGAAADKAIQDALDKLPEDS